MDARFVHHFALAAALASALAGIGAVLLYCFPIFVTRDIDVASLTHWRGNSYAVSILDQLPRGVAGALLRVEFDSNESPTASSLRLIEQGVQIGIPHSLHAEIAEVGQGRFSHWGNDLVLSSSDNSDPRTNGRSYAVSFPVSPPWWLVLSLLTAGGLGLSVLLSATNGRDLRLEKSGGAPYTLLKIFFTRVAGNRRYIFWSGVAILWFYLNTVFWLLLPAPVPSPDSDGYLNWSLFRTVGYPLLLHFYHLAFRSWEYLALFQLNLLLAGVFFLTYAVTRITGSYFIGWLFLALVVGAGNMLLSAADVLTEAAFSAFAMLHLAFTILFFERGRPLFGLLAGLALAAAVLVKSVALVLVGPLILFLLLVPASRRALFILVFCPAIVAWLTPSIYNLGRHGFFESSIAGGYALGGHVAWGIYPHSGSAYFEEASLIERRLRPVLAHRPAKSNSVGEYVNFTANEYNTLLWGNVVPELATHYANICSPGFWEMLSKCSWNECSSRCVPKLNETLQQLAKEAIGSSPRKYAYHVLAHDYGMWRDVFAAGTDFLSGAISRAESLLASYDPKSSGNLVILAPLPPFKSVSERQAIVSGIDNWASKKLFDLVMLRVLSEWVGQYVLHRYTVLMFGIGVFACLLAFRLSQLSSASKAYCYSGLYLNAYFLGTALVQPSLYRYAWTMQGVMATMLLLGMYLGGRRIAILFGAAGRRR